MTISHLALRVNSGGALRHRGSASPASFGSFDLWTTDRIEFYLRWLVSLTIGFIFCNCRIFAETATLAWDANPEPDIAGYLLSYGESSGTYRDAVDAGNTTEKEVTGLIQGKTYYFVVSAYNRSGAKSAPSTEISYTIGSDSYSKNVSPESLSVHYVDSEDPDGYSATFAIDGDPATFWHTSWRTTPSPPPHELQVDLGSHVDFNGFHYLPRSDSFNDGNIGQYEFYISADGISWGAPAASGSFSNTKDLKAVTFSQKSARYVRLRALTDANGGNYTNVAELTLTQSFQIPRDGDNTAPTAIAQDLATAEDTPLDITLTGIDSEGNSLSYSIASSPENGRLSGTAPNLTYTPTADFSGADRFTFKVNDGALDSSLATVSITVSTFNDAPTAIGSSITTSEDTPTAVLLTGSDPENSALTYAIVANPDQGRLSGTPPNLTYTPSADYNGSDRFSFTVNDGNQNSEVATVSIQITALNDLPVALASSFSTAKNTPVSVSLKGSDKDLNPLSYSIVGTPSNGTLSGSGQSLTYTPKKNFSGNDSFTFLVNDGTADSATATVSITVTPTNEAPVALAKSITTAEDTAILITLSGTDADDDSLKYSVVTNPTHGSLSGTAPNLTYTPSADFNGSDSFTFLVNDGTTNSRIESISISITPENDSPSATSLILATAEDTALPLVLSGSDPDLDRLSFIMVNPPSNGTLAGTAPDLSYIPGSNFNGSDQFTFRVNDGTTNSQAATVFITVRPVNDAPSALGKSLSIEEDKLLSVLLEGSDSDGNSLSYTITSAPSNGILSGITPNLNYSPAPNFSGSDSFSYRVNDGKIDSEIATISITVTQLNDAPVANSIVLETAIDSPQLFVLGGSDVEGDLLTYTIVTPPLNGTLSGKAPNLTYTPNKNYSGSDRLTFKARDGSLESAVATVSITVTPRDKETTIKPGIFLVHAITRKANESEPIVPEKLATEPEVETALQFRKVSGPAWLSVSDDGILSGTPGKSDIGINSFILNVSDPFDLTDEATLTVSVEPLIIAAASINQAPAFLNNPITMADASANASYTGQSLAGQAVDPDENDSLRYWKVAGPAWLNIALNGELSGVPPTSSSGQNLFTIAVADSSSSVAFSQLQINVTGLPLPWSTANLGTGQIAGTCSFRAGTFTQAGSGALGNKSDKLFLTYQKLIGDGEIVAKLTPVQAAGPSSCIGVMIRDSLSPSASEAFIGISDDQSYRQVSRTKFGKSSAVRWFAKGDPSNSWVKLVHNAKKRQIYAYRSSDGVKWALVGTIKVKMQTTCIVGLAVSSGSDSTLTTANFSNVWVSP